MGISDVIWMAIVLVGAGAILYRTFRKTGGKCGGCKGGGCCDKGKKP